MSYRSWCFTWNNYSEEDLKAIGEWKVSRLVVGKEIAPTTGTPHLQGSVTFTNTWRLAGLKALGKGIHWERMKDTRTEGPWNYCKEDGDVVYNIDNRCQGKRSDLEEIADALKEGTTVREVALAHPASFMRYHAGIEKLASLAAPRVTKPKHSRIRWPLITDWSVSHVVCGQSNIGKTEWAKQHFPGGCLVVSQMDDLKEFDASKHDGIVFDDMCFTHMPRQAQIHITDIDDDRSIYCRYGNAHIPANTKKIFTTNVLPIFLEGDPAIDRRVRIRHLYPVGVTVTEVTEGNTRLPSQMGEDEEAHILFG